MPRRLQPRCVDAGDDFISTLPVPCLVTTAQSGSASVSEREGDAGCSRFRFAVSEVAPDCCARRGSMETPRGLVETPAFMPVGTQATIKTLLPSEVRRTGAQ